MKTINGPLQSINVLTLKKFLDNVKVKEVGNTADLFQFNTLVDYEDVNSLTGDQTIVGETDSLYRRASMYLFPENSDHYKNQLAEQSRTSTWFKRDLKDIVEDLVVLHATEFGYDPVLVLVSPRVWLLANPEDFRIIKNERGYTGLACYSHCRSFLVQISKIEESTVLSSAAKSKVGEFEVDLTEVTKQIRHIQQ